MGGPGKTHIQGPGLQISTNNSRITVVDCLRGFALFGLFILHMVEYFELFWHAPEWGWVHDTVFFLFGGKAYAVFSLLFGLSFFIIMDNQARRGVDFRGRFAWRLALLLALGYLHGLLYSGDILQVLALSGFLLILIYPLSTRWILAIAAACLLQPVLLTQLLSLAAGGKPGGEPLHWSLMGETFGIYASGSFGEVVQRNVLIGQAGKWLFMIESGRIWNVVGLFLVGFVLGRVDFFRLYREKLHLCLAALAGGLLLLGVLQVGQALLDTSSLPEATTGRAGALLTQYANSLLTASGVVLFLLAYEIRWLRLPMNWLAPCGRMSLTIYVTQSLYGVPLFYGFGLGLYQGFGQVNALLLGLALWVAQMLLAGAWIKHFHYGPFEWAWRAATYGTLAVPWRRAERSA
jgi:uncharacterized protein